MTTQQPLRLVQWTSGKVATEASSPPTLPRPQCGSTTAPTNCSPRTLQDADGGPGRDAAWLWRMLADVGDG